MGAGLLMLLLAAPPAGAQGGARGGEGVQGSIDIGAAAVRYGDSVHLTTATLTPTLQVQSPRSAIALTGTYAQGSAGVWSAQGELSGSLFTPPRGPVQGELAARAGGSTHEDGARTGELLLEGRGYLARTRWGAWAGGGVGRTWDGAVWRGIVLGEVGGWARLGSAVVGAGLTPTAVDDTIRYTDAELSLGWSGGRVELGGVMGARAGARLPIGGGSDRWWGSLTAIIRLRDRVGLLASGGSYPVDFTQGYPGGRFIVVGLRLSARPLPGGGARSPTEGRSDGARETPASGAVRAFEVSRAPDGARTIRVRAPGAQRVEIAGDFTDWAPVPLSPAPDGWWVTTLPISPGPHQMNLRLDGGIWLVPPGLLRIADESGTAGLLVIEP